MVNQRIHSINEARQNNSRRRETNNPVSYESVKEMK